MGGKIGGVRQSADLSFFKITDKKMNKTSWNKKLLKYDVNENGCWIVISHACNDSGYPCASIFGKLDRIHRHIYALHVLKQHPMTPNVVVRHTCDNRKCINPKHLVSGTHKDNVADRVKRKRSAIGEINGRSKLTEFQVKIIKQINLPHTELAKRYNVTRKAIYSIKNNLTWKHI